MVQISLLPMTTDGTGPFSLMITEGNHTLRLVVEGLMDASVALNQDTKDYKAYAWTGPDAPPLEVVTNFIYEFFKACKGSNE